MIPPLAPKIIKRIMPSIEKMQTEHLSLLMLVANPNIAIINPTNPHIIVPLTRNEFIFSLAYKSVVEAIPPSMGAFRVKLIPM
jgi:hypothetical protein